MRILTGLQPSGKLHVGNYFGAMEPAVRLQDIGEAFYFIADYHAMTSSQNPAALRENVRELADWTRNVRCFSNKARCPRSTNWHGSSRRFAR
jgi:hypothetical protein